MLFGRPLVFPFFPIHRSADNKMAQVMSLRDASKRPWTSERRRVDCDTSCYLRSYCFFVARQNNLFELVGNLLIEVQSYGKESKQRGIKARSSADRRHWHWIRSNYWGRYLCGHRSGGRCCWTFFFDRVVRCWCSSDIQRPKFCPAGSYLPSV